MTSRWRAEYARMGLFAVRRSLGSGGVHPSGTLPY
jgi:hypothetical protein